MEKDARRAVMFPIYGREAARQRAREDADRAKAEQIIPSLSSEDQAVMRRVLGPRRVC